MEAPVLWKPLFCGGPYFMEAPVLWKPLFYGGPCFMEASVLWRPLFCGSLCFVEAPVLRKPLFYGGPCFVEASVLWKPLFYGGRCFMEAPVAPPCIRPGHGIMLRHLGDSRYLCKYPYNQDAHFQTVVKMDITDIDSRCPYMTTAAFWDVCAIYTYIGLCIAYITTTRKALYSHHLRFCSFFCFLFWD
jgi:hypothetical protein